MRLYLGQNNKTWKIIWQNTRNLWFTKLQRCQRSVHVDHYAAKIIQIFIPKNYVFEKIRGKLVPIFISKFVLSTSSSLQ